MHRFTGISKIATAALTCTALAGTALAGQYGMRGGDMDESNNGYGSGMNDSRTEEWRSMQDEYVELSELMSGDMSNGLRAVGDVEHVVLDENTSRVQYVVYEPERLPWDAYLTSGYFSFQDIDLIRRIGDLTLRVENEIDAKGPEELEITADEAEYRLASRVVDSRLETRGERFYEIEDLLINRNSGEVDYFVIGATENALFSDERRAVPADKVMFRNGEFRTTLTWSKIEKRQPYDPGLL